MRDRAATVQLLGAAGTVTGSKHLVSVDDRRVLLDGGLFQGLKGPRNQEITVRARVVKLDGFSAHADQGELLRWLGGLTPPPRRTIAVHGEPQAADTLAALIRHRLGW